MSEPATQRESRSSIELTRNTKGYGWSVKRYQQDGETLADVLMDLETIERQLRLDYGNEVAS